ncbi:hypothetical protein CKO28_01255 [Rhodovibrio sodomensis]|uniref:Uncharacterized protein n=1 Tax=Rhodovibrio sodomensis TaxID=1088 RepID=A0ABS1D9M0_9PROT|nr:hypothetical protein [Rhodovibrio sodomensis]MBK1666671.1 hypothetical protein [Rhodovibrio sodomensis]
MLTFEVQLDPEKLIRTCHNLHHQHYLLLRGLNHAWHLSHALRGRPDDALRDLFMSLPIELLQPIGYSRNEASVMNARDMALTLLHGGPRNPLASEMREAPFADFPDRYPLLAPHPDLGKPGLCRPVEQLKAAVEEAHARDQS